MDWNQIFIIVVEIFGVVGSIGGFVLWSTTKLDGDLKLLASRIDNDTKMLISRIDSSHARIDQLYQMFVDLLKEGQKKG
jgi:hypothetical protein